MIKCKLLSDNIFYDFNILASAILVTFKKEETFVKQNPQSVSKEFKCFSQVISL